MPLPRYQVELRQKLHNLSNSRTMPERPAVSIIPEHPKDRPSQDELARKRAMDLLNSYAPITPVVCLKYHREQLNTLIDQETDPAWREFLVYQRELRERTGRWLD